MTKAKVPWWVAAAPKDSHGRTDAEMTFDATIAALRRIIDQLEVEVEEARSTATRLEGELAQLKVKYQAKLRWKEEDRL